MQRGTIVAVLEQCLGDSFGQSLAFSGSDNASRLGVSATTMSQHNLKHQQRSIESTPAYRLSVKPIIAVQRPD
jgi:hypothetical protein